MSLANKLDKKDWDKLRKKVYEAANWTCQICGSMGERMFCHEVWNYEDRQRIQRLVGLQCICELCHDVKHYGRSKAVKSKTYTETLVKHWCKVNKRTRQDFALYEQLLYEINKKRVDIVYTVKIGRSILL